MNQLPAVAINEGVRYKKRLRREAGRKRLESLWLAPWASRRRQDLLEVLDRINPTIAELTQAIEEEAEKCPPARRLMTHPGVGALTAVAFVLIIGEADRSKSGHTLNIHKAFIAARRASGLPYSLVLYGARHGAMSDFATVLPLAATTQIGGHRDARTAMGYQHHEITDLQARLDEAKTNGRIN